MNFSAEQISPEKWGIYSDSKLLATVSSEVICKTVIANLSNGRRDLPAQDTNALYQITAALRPPQIHPKQVVAAANSANIQSSASTQPSSQSAQPQVAQPQSVQPQVAQPQSIEDMLDSLSDKQLEEVLIKAQTGSIKGSLEMPLSYQRRPGKKNKAISSANSRSSSSAALSNRQTSSVRSAV